jgi:hypothetical protein
MKLGVTLDILNQKDTPAFYADTLANRPAAGFTGRVFISTDTLDLYRDTGTTWVLLSPSSTGTITGSGAAGQVTYFSAASSITGSNDLFFDSVNGHLGIGTITPSTALTIFHDQNQIIQINQTTATNDTKIAFQNSGTPLWRIGNSYNAGANDYAIYDVVGAIQPLTIKKTSGQVLIGTTTIGSGKLVVASSTGDNGIQIVGATAPSLRIDSAESGPTKRIGLGISTATNNFIQGSADRDMCIFNGSTTASPILFGIYDTTNVQEAARISAARNFLIGTTTDSGYKLNVNGTAYINDRLVLDGTVTSQYIQFFSSGVDKAHIYYDIGLNSLTLGTYVAGGSIQFETGNNVDAMSLTSAGDLGIGTTTPSYKLDVIGAIQSRVASGNGSLYVNNASLTNKNWTFIPSTNGAESDLLLFYTGTGAGTKVTFSNNGNTSIAGDLSLTPTNSALIFSSGFARIFIGASEAVRIATTGNFLIGTTTDAGQKLQVNGDVATNGVKFPATQVPSADVNTLDDYEEGTFVPQLNFGGANVGMTYFDNIGNYTKIGRQVTITLYLALTNIGSSTGTASITNLPFTSTSTNRAGASSGNITFDNILYTGQLSVSVGAGANSISFQQTTELGVDTSLSQLNFNNSSEMFITITYFA